MTVSLVDRYEAVGFDLDGVVYRGPRAVPGAAETIAELDRRGLAIGFVTNNAQRSPVAVAEHLGHLGIACPASSIVTSAQAEARLMAGQLAPGSEVLVVGSEALAAEVTAVGLRPVRQRGDQTAAVVIGFEPTLTWEDFNQAAYAVQHGARYFACNNDWTRPTDSGIAIGLGGMLAALRAALPSVEPVMAGKPFRPLLDETIRRLRTRNLIMVGDRLDTDIAGARRAGLDSLLVLSGSHGKADLCAARADERPTWLASDVSGLLTPGRQAVIEPGQVRCRSVTAKVSGGVIELDSIPSDRDGQVDALWAVANLVWTTDTSVAEPVIDWWTVIATLDLVP